MIQTDHKPLVYAFSQQADKASPCKLRQLDYIGRFTTEIVYTKGEENVVADALSRINSINMPTSLDAETIHIDQQQDNTLANLIENSSLNLHNPKMDNHYIHCDIPSGLVRPYIPDSLRR